MRNRPNPIKAHDRDFTFMRQALDIAREGLGRVAPNPSVGCIIAKDGVVVGKARSADGGRPHAETQALAQAGDKAVGADVYTTLEPCGHHGKTPPCVDALIEAGVGRVIIACMDPNQTHQNCISRLNDAGIEVTAGICEQEALELNEGFFKTLALGRPLVTVKIATSLDGRIATATGESQWITGDLARRKAHEYRAQHDAVMVGVGTVLADDPQLTVRHPDYNHQPVRIVIDRELKTPADSKLLQSAANGNVWLLCAGDVDKNKAEAAKEAGAKLVPLAEYDRNGLFDVNLMLAELKQQGITRLFIEGGGQTISSFLQAGVVDTLLWFRAPKLIGGDGIPAIGGLGIEKIEDTLNFTLDDQIRLGEDMLEIWKLKM